MIFSHLFTTDLPMFVFKFPPFSLAFSLWFSPSSQHFPSSFPMIFPGFFARPFPTSSDTCWAILAAAVAAWQTPNNRADWRQASGLRWWDGEVYLWRFIRWEWPTSLATLSWRSTLSWWLIQLMGSSGKIRENSMKIMGKSMFFSCQPIDWFGWFKIRYG